MKKKGYRIRRYEKRRKTEKLITIIVSTASIFISVVTFIGISHTKSMAKPKEDSTVVEVSQVENKEIKENEVVESEAGNIDKSGIILVNRENELSKSYEPKNLVVANVRTNKEILLENETSLMLKKLFEKASQQGISLILVSGYRSYSYQQQLYNESLANNGVEHTNKYVAKPGQSEHQTGLAADVVIDGYGDLTAAFGETEAGKWLAKNAHEFGFIIRYKKGKEDITGYNYEPWHIRYVGVDVANEIENSGITLEEYLK